MDKKRWFCTGNTFLRKTAFFRIFHEETAIKESRYQIDQSS